MFTTTPRGVPRPREDPTRQLSPRNRQKARLGQVPAPAGNPALERSADTAK